MAGLQDLADSAFVPLTMVLELTRRCNLACRHCYLPPAGADARAAGGELSTGEWVRVLDELAEAGTMFLTLTGGEVLLRQDLSIILESARSRSFHVELFTNATLLTRRDADLWASVGIAAAGVSVYGPDDASHDRVTGSAGSFSRSISGVGLLRERGIPVRFKVPLMRSNASSYRAIVSLAKSLGASWQVDPLLTPGNDGADIPAALGLDDNALSSVFKDPLLCPEGSLAAAAPPGPADSPCSAGRTFGSIGPDGEVFPCLQWLEPAGSVRDRSFKDIWQGSRVLTEARSRVWRDLKPCPICSGPHYSHCPGLSSIEHGDPAVPASGSCRLTRALDSAAAAATTKEKP